jgi:A/G-specific adenine glycosylase
MLQQTRVATVIPYFERFTARFPDLQSLAAADADEVMRHWAGLGYYARARNLQRAARQVLEIHDGRLPDDSGALQALPGIGRSTAGAILALAHGRRAAILDGNVKRVLARWHGIDAWPGLAAVNRHLWSLSERHTPERRVGDYTQAIMDLGATVCTPRRPGCAECPVADGCNARRTGRAALLPVARPASSAPPLRRCHFLILRDGEGRCYLERNPPSGIWGGLWCFPRYAREAELRAACVPLAVPGEALVFLPPRRHTFGHFRLDFTPVLARVAEPVPGVGETGSGGWFQPADAQLAASGRGPGVPAPVARLLAELSEFPTSENRT